MQNCETAITQEGRHRCELQTDFEVSRGSREEKAAPRSAGRYPGESGRAETHVELGEPGRTVKEECLKQETAAETQEEGRTWKSTQRRLDMMRWPRGAAACSRARESCAERGSDDDGVQAAGGRD